MIMPKEKQEIEKHIVLAQYKEIEPEITKKLDQLFSKEGWVNFVSWDATSVELRYYYTYFLLTQDWQARVERVQSDDGEDIYYRYKPELQRINYKSWLIPVKMIQPGNEEKIVSWLKKSYPWPFF